MKNKMVKAALIGVVLLVVLSISGCRQTTAVEAEFELGYDGVVKISDGNPISAQINNQGKGFIGEVQIEVDKNGQEKLIYAKAFEIAASSEKELEMYIPIYTIQKNFKVSILVEGKEVYSQKIVPKKFISPDHTVIAVITDQPDDYRFMNAVDLPKYRIDDKFMSSYQYGIQSQSYGPLSSTVSSVAVEAVEEEKDRTHVLYFESFAEFKEKVNYDFMDYIYVGKSSHLNVTSEVEGYLLDWMNEGNTLFIESGKDYKKIMSQLPEALINYNITSTEAVEIGTLVGFPLNETMVVTQGGFSATYESDYVVLDESAYGVASEVGAGQLVTLMIDMASDPLDDWLYTHALIKEIFETTNGESDLTYYVDDRYYNNTYRLSRIPDEKAPPYAAMVLIFLIYIAVVGPIIYVVFKAKDKRDYLWIAIPVTSVFFIVVLYLVGFATRYDKPITNSISTITYSEGEGYLEVNTDIALFNNKNEDVTISWSEEENLEFSSDNDRYYGQYQESKKLVGKVLMGKQRSYTAYDTPLWTASYMTANKVLPFEAATDKPLARLLPGDEMMGLEVTNPTPLNLEYAFVTFGNSMYAIGDMEAYETVTVTEGFTGDVYQFFDSELVPNLYGDYTVEGRKRQADIEILRERAENQYYSRMDNNIGSTIDVTIFGVNRDVIGYDININDEETEDFSRNVVNLEGQISYESGEEIVLPQGSLESDYSYDAIRGHMNVYNDHNIGKVVDIYEVYEGSFEWTIPEFVEVSEIGLSVYNMYDNEVFYAIYNTYNKGTVGMPLECEFSLYNVVTNEWDPIELEDSEDATEIIVDVERYVESESVKLRFIVLDSNTTVKHGIAMLSPEVSVKGVVK